MSLTSQVFATVRQAARRAFTSGGTQSLDMNLGGELLTSQVLPERTEVVRLGRSFSAQIPLTSAFSMVITIPTTLSELSLQNGESGANALTYIIDRFWLKNTTTTTSATELTPLSQLVPAGTALVADNALVLRTNLSGSSNTSKAQLCMHSILTGCLTDKWNHHASAHQPATTNIGTVISVECYGRYLVRPGASFNINVQESVLTGVAIAGVEWHEVALDLG